MADTYQIFTTSGTFNVPAGVTTIFVEAWGAGGGGAGGGGGSGNGATPGGGGGGASGASGQYISAVMLVN